MSPIWMAWRLSIAVIFCSNWSDKASRITWMRIRSRLGGALSATDAGCSADSEQCALSGPKTMLYKQLISGRGRFRRKLARPFIFGPLAAMRRSETMAGRSENRERSRRNL